MTTVAGLDASTAGSYDQPQRLNGAAGARLLTTKYIVPTGMGGATVTGIGIKHIDNDGGVETIKMVCLNAGKVQLGHCLAASSGANEFLISSFVTPFTLPADGAAIYLGGYLDPTGGDGDGRFTFATVADPLFTLTASTDTDGSFAAPLADGATATSLAPDSQQEFAIYLIGTVGGADTTAPSLTSGPTISNVTSGGFDISGTPDEGGTASLIYLSDVTASQPSDATFDASSETAAMTAATSFNIHHTGS